METISSDEKFRQLLAGMDAARQRRVAARFVEHVLPLCSDERVTRVARVAAMDDVSANELADALRTARTAAIESHNRCGAECDWRDQAGYFVARAVVAAVSPPEHFPGGTAWQAAVSSRMARTCESIDAQADNAGAEQDYQYRILSEFLDTE